jgi:glucokinase
MAMHESMVAIDLGGTKILGGLLSSGGELTRRREVPTTAEAGARDVLLRLTSLIQGLRLQAPGPVVGIGICTPGIVRAGKVEYATPNLPGWTGLHLAEELSRAIGLPVWVENDAHAAAWGEFRYGVGRGVQDMVLFTLGTGVGGGIVVDGKLVRGDGGLAARLGHLSVGGGPACHCGNRGCVEQYASGRAVERWFSTRLGSEVQSPLCSGDDLTARAVVESARQGDPLALEVLARAGKALGRAMVQVVQVLNPAVIAVGGGLAAAEALLLVPAQKVVRSRARPEATATLRILPAHLGSDAGIFGTGQLAWDNLPRAHKSKHA